MNAGEIIDRIREFVKQESEFIPDIHSDELLDRLVKEINKLEREVNHDKQEQSKL